VDTHKCAKEECDEQAMTSNAITLPSRIGIVVVFVCQEHFSAFFHAKRTERMESIIAKLGACNALDAMERIEVIDHLREIEP